MTPELNKKYLITTDKWFLAPDGKMYRGVFGTVKSIDSDEKLLGVKTNSKSTNWYLQIGNMIIAGCQIHYAVQSDSCDFEDFTRETEFEGKVLFNKEGNTRIYNADEEEANN